MELYMIGCGTSYVWKTNEIPERIGAKACGTLNMTTDELNGRMMTYLIKSLELAMKEHNFCMIDEAESLIKEYREFCFSFGRHSNISLYPIPAIGVPFARRKSCVSNHSSHKFSNILLLSVKVIASSKPCGGL